MSSTRRRSILKYGITFLALMLSGFVIWVLSTPSVAVIFLGESGYEAAYSSLLYGFFGLPLLALPPLIAGFISPRGFFLWGIVVVFPYLPGAVWIYLRAGAEATFLDPDPGAGQILSLVFVQLMILLFLALVCTMAAGVGAAFRALVWRLRGRPVMQSLGLSGEAERNG